MHVLTYFKSSFTIFCLLSLCCVQSESALKDYINSAISYLGYKQHNEDTGDSFDMDFSHSIPYEVSTLDEKFISEAVKLTGVAISELDSCQHRAVLKLKADCYKMNDEQLAKMAVHLLNCQSYVEGRRIFPCTDEMNIKDCTQDMDSDTWTSYHLMSNRARAVCHIIRQSQFRGLAEQTINRLMATSRDQLRSLGTIANQQENILNLAENTYDSLSKAQEQLSEQQKDMQRAQLHNQLVLESNIMKLVDEKRLIQDTHNRLIEMTKGVQNKLENSAQLITEQNVESQANHQELLQDITTIQKKANDLFEKIDAYSELLLKQNEEFKTQYESTLRNLQEVNRTVHSLVNLVGGTRQALEDKLSWLMQVIGGTDDAIERLSLILSHVGLVLTSMLGCAFLSARPTTRLFIVTLPSLNLIFALYGRECLDILPLVASLGLLIGCQTLIVWALRLKRTLPLAIGWSSKTKASPAKSAAPDLFKEEDYSSYKRVDSNGNAEYQKRRFEREEHNANDEETDTFEHDSSYLTPPVSRAGHYASLLRSRSRSNTPLRLNTSLRAACQATTRAGTPCKITSIPGRDYCYRHQNGDSIMG